MTKLRDVGWKDRDRNSQLANAIWPHLSDPETRKHGQFIDLLSSFSIIENRQLVRLYPLQDTLTGWYSG